MPTLKTARTALLAFAALGAAHLAAPARASDVSADKIPSSYAALMKMKPLEVMHMMDAGGKGYVTREEFMKFEESVFRKLDRNADGKLSASEFTDQG